MAELLKGAPAAAAVCARLKPEVEALTLAGIQPTLAIVRVGERPDDLAYERGALKRCAACGVAVRQFVLPEFVTEGELLSVIDGLNRDASIHGVLLFRPLPEHICDETVRRTLLAEKDVDGITDGSLAGVFTGTELGFPPCTAEACLELLSFYNIDPCGKRAVVVGRSLVVGRPAAMLLLSRNATVTICHTRTKNLNEVCREADILIVAAGKAGVIGAEACRPGQIVLDVGIHATESGELTGDVRFSEVSDAVSAITPVPGGVGAVTTSLLAAHTVRAAMRSIR